MKYFSGNLSSDEVRKIDAWRSESDANAFEFLESHQAWKFSKEPKVDSKAALNVVMGRIDSLEEQRAGSSHLSLGHYLKYAAAAILVIGIGFLGKGILPESPEQIAIKAIDNLEIIALPDGSVVTLSENSILTYDKKFIGGTRNVSLKGKAFFDIQRDESKPFIVNTDQSKIEVLGTSFLVNTESSNATTEVVVKTGRVSVSKNESKKSEKVELIAGEVGRLVGDAVVFEKSTIENYNYLAWKTKLIVFDDQVLSNVLQTLKEVYEVEIIVSDENIYNCQMSAKFDNQPIESVLEILSKTFNLELTKSGRKEFHLSGKGCFTVQ